MEAEHAGTMKRVELKIERDLNNYISFLDELDKMKGHIVAAFEGCSPIQALLIHQHSCRILNNMWEEKDIEQRQLLEIKLLTLMASVQNDLASKLSTPEGTLKILAAPSQ